MDVPTTDPTDLAAAQRAAADDAEFAADARVTRILVRVLVIGGAVLLVWFAVVLAAFSS